MIAGFAGLALLFLSAASDAADAPVRVMIVGGFHMNSPGRDLHNVQVDDMLTPARQAQIAAVTDGLALFKPTAVAAEWPADIAAQRYADYRAGKLPPSHNEVVQLGFRLAAAANLGASTASMSTETFLMTRFRPMPRRMAKAPTWTPPTRKSRPSCANRRTC